MKRFLIILSIILFASGLVWAAPPSAPTQAKHSKTDTTNFDNNLSGTDVTVQDALETLDEVVGVGDTTETNQDDAWSILVDAQSVFTLITMTYTDATDSLTVTVENDLNLYDWTNVDGTDLKTGSVTQAYDADLTTYAGITPSANVQSLLSAADYAAIRTLMDLEASTDFYSQSAADAAFQAIDDTLSSISDLGTAADKMAYTTGIDTWAEAAITAAGRAIIDDADASAQRTTLGLVIGTNVQAQNATLQTIADASDVPGANVDIANTTTEASIAADDLILIYDVTATANRAMTRGNFVTGIGAGQSITLDIGDDGGDDSTDLGEIATSGDTNSIVTEPGPDKALFDMGQNWPQADTAVAASTQAITDNAIATIDDADAADNDFAKFTAAGLEGRSYAEVRSDLGIDSAANLETSLSLGAYASDILGAADSDALVTLLGLVAGDIPDLSATYEPQLANSAGLASAISDETGTGVVVFGTAPTFTTSIAFTNVTDTVAGIQNQNLVDKAAAEAISGVWEVQDNTLLNFGNDADWGIRYDTTGTELDILSNNAGTMTVDISNAGAGVANLDIDGAISEGGTSLASKYQGLHAYLTDIAGLTLTVGDILYVDASGDIVQLDAGTNGYFLQAQGAAAPAWAEGSSTGVNETYGAGWDGDTSAPEKDDVYDIIENILDGTQAFTAITMAGVTAPGWTFLDSNGLGADDEAAKILANMTTVTDGAEVSDFALTFMDTGTRENFLRWDGSDHLLILGPQTDGWAGGDVTGVEQLTIDFNAGEGLIAITSVSSASIDFQVTTVTVDALTTSGILTIGGNLVYGSADLSEAELEILDGSTVTTTELEQLATIGATTISANQWALLGGVAETLGAAELNLLDGKSLAGSDASILTGTAGTDTYTAVWNADGDLVDGYDPTSKANVADVDVEMLIDVTGEGTAATYALFDDNDGTYSFRAIAATDIPDNLIDSQHYAAASIDNEHLADDAADSDEIASGAIDFDHLSAGAKFQSLAVADLADSATPSVLTVAETTNKVISNYKVSGADHVFTMPAAHAAGNVIFPIGDEFQVDIEPDSGANFFLNGTAMAADEHIQNTADTLGERIVGYVANINGTLTWMFYSSDAAWVEATP